MKKLISISYYPGPGETEPAVRAVEMTVRGDWGYHAGTEVDCLEEYAWVRDRRGCGYLKRAGVYYIVTHTPSGLMAAKHLTKANAQRMVKELSGVEIKWDGVEKNCDEFLRAVREIVLEYPPHQT